MCLQFSKEINTRTIHVPTIQRPLPNRRSHVSYSARRLVHIFEIEGHMFPSLCLQFSDLFQIEGHMFPIQGGD